MTSTFHTDSPTSRLVLDRSIATLSATARAWADRSIEERIDDLRQIRARTIEVAPDLVAEATRAKGIGADLEGEEWASGPLAVLRTLRFLQDTLEGIHRTGEVPLPDSAFRERPDGQVSVEVMPSDRWDRILYRGWSASIRMDPEIRKAQARRSVGGAYTSGGFTPGVSLVLGAGNVSSIAPLDVVHKLFTSGHTTLLKFNPVNEYIAPYVEYAFSHLMELGFVRTARGGAETGEYLVFHPAIDDVHITGSETTHDVIVFGAGDEGLQRKVEHRPRLTKPITSELGNVSPTIVAPGSWSDRQLRYHAEHVATQLIQNAGYNCVAAKALIIPESWPQADEWLGLIGAALESRADRPAYYPGSMERYERVVSAGGRVSRFGRSSDGLPPTMIEIDRDEEHPAFSVEAFCRLMAVVRLPGDSPAAFLDEAVEFANDRLRGTLNATLLIDPATLKENGPAAERAIDRLTYGTVALNVWAAAGYPLGVTPWGGHPGHTLEDVGSGIGFVHNARLIDRPQKTVIRAPFVLFPKPAWSVFHRNGTAALRRASEFEAAPALARLPGLLSAALRA